MRIGIRRIQQSFGITSIYVTQDQAEAMTISGRTVVTNDGEVMQVGTPVEICSRPVNAVVSNPIEAGVFGDGEHVTVDRCAGAKTFDLYGRRRVTSWTVAVVDGRITR